MVVIALRVEEAGDVAVKEIDSTEFRRFLDPWHRKLSEHEAHHFPALP
jgi:hypothetical protein